MVPPLLKSHVCVLQTIVVEQLLSNLFFSLLLTCYSFHRRSLFRSSVWGLPLLTPQSSRAPPPRLAGSDRSRRPVWIPSSRRVHQGLLTSRSRVPRALIRTAKARRPARGRHRRLPRHPQERVKGLKSPLSSSKRSLHPRHPDPLPRRYLCRQIHQICT